MGLLSSSGSQLLDDVVTRCHEWLKGRHPGKADIYLCHFQSIRDDIRAYTSQLIAIGTLVVSVGIAVFAWFLQDTIRWRMDVAKTISLAYASEQVGSHHSIAGGNFPLHQAIASTISTAQRTPGFDGMLATPVVGLLIMLVMMLALIVVITVNHLDYFITLRRLQSREIVQFMRLTDSSVLNCEGIGAGQLNFGTSYICATLLLIMLGLGGAILYSITTGANGELTIYFQTMRRVWLIPLCLTMTVVGVVMIWRRSRCRQHALLTSVFSFSMISLSFLPYAEFTYSGNLGASSRGLAAIVVLGLVLAYKTCMKWSDVTVRKRTFLMRIDCIDEKICGGASTAAIVGEIRRGYPSLASRGRFDNLMKAPFWVRVALGSGLCLALLFLVLSLIPRSVWL